MVSQKVVTPVETGVQLHDNELSFLDSGACPGPDQGLAGMTKKGNFGLLTVSSMFSTRQANSLVTATPTTTNKRIKGGE
jgi:hypothetical protein